MGIRGGPPVFFRKELRHFVSEAKKGNSSGKDQKKGGGGGGKRRRKRPGLGHKIRV